MTEHDEERLTFESTNAACGRPPTWLRLLLLATFAVTCVGLGTAAFAPRVASQLYENLIGAASNAGAPTVSP